MKLTMLQERQTVHPGNAASFRFALTGARDLEALHFRVSASEQEFNPRWCTFTNGSAATDRQLDVKVPLRHALPVRRYHLRVSATDPEAGAEATATCLLIIATAAVKPCARFPAEGRKIELTDHGIDVHVPILSCDRLKFEASVEVRRTDGMHFEVDNPTVTVDVDELVTIEATAHVPHDGPAVTVNNVTVTVHYGESEAPVWPPKPAPIPIPDPNRRHWYRRPAVAAAAIVGALVIAGGIANAVDGSHRHPTPVADTAPTAPKSTTGRHPTTSHATTATTEHTTSSLRDHPTTSTETTIAPLTVTTVANSALSLTVSAQSTTCDPTFTATVSSPSPVAPTGSVSFSSDNGPPTIVPLDGSTATWSTTLSPGTRTIHAAYSGDAAHSPSTAPQLMYSQGYCIG